MGNFGRFPPMIGDMTHLRFLNDANRGISVLTKAFLMRGEGLLKNQQSPQFQSYTLPRSETETNPLRWDHDQQVRWKVAGATRRQR